MTKMVWKTGAVTDLAQLLKSSTITQSAAVGVATVYHFNHDGQEKIAISLPDELAVVIELNSNAQQRRRRIDPAKMEAEAASANTSTAAANVAE